MSFKSPSSPDGGDIVIRARNLTKIFPIYARPIDRLKQAIFPSMRRILGLPQKDYCTHFTALDNVSFEIRKGDTVGILGHNGAGKSTLLQLLCGTLSPTSGEIIVKGRVAALLELGAGFNGEYTGRENVYMNAHILGLSNEEIDARFDDIAKFADIGDFIERPVKSYSSGMYARLAFAVAICVNPDVLIIDEALAVGDAKFQNKCFNRLKELKHSGTTILFVSHAIEQVRLICDKGIVLERGVLSFFGTAKEATLKYLALSDSSKHISNQPHKISSKIPEMHSSNWKIPIEDIGDQEIIGVGGAILNRFRIEELTYPNIVFSGQRLIFSCDFSWDIGLLKGLIEESCYDDNITVGLALSSINGIYLFGCNGFDTFLKIDLFKKQNAIVDFEFYVPNLIGGDYFFSIAIAVGSQEKHKQLRWYDNIFQIKLIERGRKVFGTFAIEYTTVEQTDQDLDYEQTST